MISKKEEKIIRILLSSVRHLTRLLIEAEYQLNQTKRMLKEISPKSFKYVIEIQKEHDEPRDDRGQEEFK